MNPIIFIKIDKSFASVFKLCIYYFIKLYIKCTLSSKLKLSIGLTLYNIIIHRNKGLFDV